MSLKARLAHLLLAAMTGGGIDVAAAQPCNGPLPAPAASMPGDSAPAEGSGPAEGLQRFRLIASSCPTLPASRGPARPAEQLQLFDRATVVALSWQDAPTQTTTLAMAALPVPRAPLNRDGERIVALAPALIDAARAHRLDPLLLHAIAHVESRHNPQAVSPAGARGLMQVMPATAERFGVKNGERTLQDPETNLRASAALLRSLQQRYGADLRLVLAAYNAGEGAVAKHGNDVPPYPETQAYVRDVSAVYRRLQSEFSVSRAGELVARGP